jgi:hypothetical protein
MPSAGEKVLLTLTEVDVPENGPIQVKQNNTFSAMLNPTEFSQKRTIAYNTRPRLGQVSSPTKFSSMAPGTVSFALVIDGTGAVPAPAGKPWPSVSDQLKKLTGVVYKYNGSNHEPNHVRVLWGTLIFYGRLSSMSTQYTLFKPSGDPLRAKVSLDFTGFMSTREEELAAGRSSPDLTHVIDVREGDTLPLMCQRIYGDPTYYLEVARANGLASFRHLQAGLRLRFPPVA